MTIRINSHKKEASDLFQSLGLDLSTAIGMFYIQALCCHDVPFFVVADEEPNRKIYMTMKNAENDTNMSGPFESIEDLTETLDA